MVIKELPSLVREKLANTGFISVVVLAIIAHILDACNAPALKNKVVLYARERYWAYVNERQKEFDNSLAEWTGPNAFSFVIKRYTAIDVSEIKTVTIRAASMFEALVRLNSYNQGPNFAIISKQSDALDEGVWAAIVSAKTKFIAPVEATIPNNTSHAERIPTSNPDVDLVMGPLDEVKLIATEELAAGSEVISPQLVSNAPPVVVSPSEPVSFDDSVSDNAAPAPLDAPPPVSKDRSAIFSDVMKTPLRKKVKSKVKP